MPIVSRQSRRRSSSAAFRRVTAMPADPDVVDGALRLVVDLARSCVDGADGVSVSLVHNGVLSAKPPELRPEWGLDG